MISPITRPAREAWARVMLNTAFATSYLISESPRFSRRGHSCYQKHTEAEVDGFHCHFFFQKILITKKEIILFIFDGCGWSRRRGTFMIFHTTPVLKRFPQTLTVYVKVTNPFSIAF